MQSNFKNGILIDESNKGKKDKGSIFGRLRNVENQAILFNYVTKDTLLFTEYITLPLSVAAGLAEIVVALVIMQQCSIVDPYDETNPKTVSPISIKFFYMINKIKDNQLYLQAAILAIQLFYILLHIIELIQAQKPKITTFSTLNRYLIAIITIGMITIMWPFVTFIGVSSYFLNVHDESPQNIVIIVLGSFNLILVSLIAIAITDIYLYKIAHIKNSISTEHSIQPLFQILQKVMLMVTIFATMDADSQIDNQFQDNKKAYFLVPLTLTAYIVNMIYKLLKTTNISLSRYIVCVLSITIISILLVTFMYSKLLLKKTTNYFNLVIYSVIVSVGANLGSFFIFWYLQYSRLRLLHGNRLLDEQNWIQGLSVALNKLTQLISEGNSSPALMELLIIVRLHRKSCKEQDCICKLYKDYMVEIHKQDLYEMNYIVNDHIGIKSEDQVEDDQGAYATLFLAKFLIMLNKRALSFFPNSLLLTNIGLEIIKVANIRNIMLSQFLLVNLQNSHGNALFQLKVKQLELLIQGISNSQQQKDENLNPDKIIENHKLQHSLKSSLSNLGFEVNNLWNLLQLSTQPQDHVQKICKQQNRMAQYVIQSQTMLQALEESGQDKIYTYYMLSIVHKLIFNDQIAGINYIRKLQSLNDINRLFIQRQTFEVQEVSFMIVSSKLDNFGKILIANKNLHTMAGYDFGELEKSSNIEQLMPKNIKNRHSFLIKKLVTTGDGGRPFSSNGLNTFIVKKNGYIILTNLKIQLRYTAEFGFIYAAYFQKQNKFSLDYGTLNSTASNAQISTKDTMIFICEEDDLKVCEITETCRHLISLDVRYLTSKELDTRRDYLSLYDLFQDSIPQLEQFEHDKSQTTMIVSLNIDKLCIKQMQHSLRIHEYEKMPVVINLVRKYIKREKNMPDYCYLIGYVVYDTNQIISSPLNKSQAETIGLNVESFQFKDNDNQKILPNSDQDLELQNMIFEASLGDNSSQDSTNSSNTLTQSPENIKQFLNATLTSNMLSKSLKMLLQLVVFLFLVMICISSLNLYLTVTRHINQRKEILVVKQTYDRLNSHAHVRAMSRNLINMANGYEPRSSSFSKDRVQQITNKLQQQLYSIKETLDSLDQVANQNQYGFIIPKRMVEVQNLANDFNTTVNIQSYSTAYHLFITNALTLITQNLSTMEGNSNAQRVEPNYTLPSTDNEKLVSFVTYNSMGQIVTRNWQESQDYQSQSIQHSEQAISRNLTTTLISIFSILLVGCIITPMIARFQKRKYESVNFYLLLNSEQIQLALANCQQFLTQVEEESKVGKNNKSQKFAKLQNQRNQLTYQSYAIKQSESSQVSESYDGSSVMSNSVLSLLTQNEQSVKMGENEDNSNNYNENQSQSRSQKLIDNKDQSFADPAFPKHVAFQANANKNHPMIRANPISNGSQVASSQDESQDQNNQSSMSFDHHKRQDNASQQIELKQEEKITQAQQSKDAIKKQVNTAKSRAQTLVLFLIGLLISTLVMYFVGTYLLTLKAFQSVPQILGNLSMIYQRDACIENAIAYIRENQILSSVIMMEKELTGTGQQEIGSTFTLNQCLDIEKQYRDLKKDIPGYFQDAAAYIREIEDDMCGVTQNKLGIQITDCHSSYNGIMDIGYSAAIGLVLAEFQKVDLYFFAEKNKTSKWYYDIVQDIAQIDLMEINEFLLFPLATNLKLEVVNSTISYFRKLRLSYIGVFCAFIALIILVLIFFILKVYSRMKYQSLLTNQAFRVLPLEFLTKEDLGGLKQFCLS